MLETLPDKSCSTIVRGHVSP